MEALIQVQLQSIAPYLHLFPKALAVDRTAKRNADVGHTVKFIPWVIKKTHWQVKRFVDQELRGLPTYEACKKLWHFVKYHIRYEKDETYKEQVRSPRRLIHDLKGDCDCFTTFIDACLYELRIPAINRITKYGTDRFQHIYPIVPIGGGRYITMDCVVNRFNYEEPFTEKEDHKMDLQFLDGLDVNEYNLNGVDAQDLLGANPYDLGELGKLLKRKKAQSSSGGGKGAAKKKIGKAFQKVKAVAKKGLHIANRANPATALLRGGILASMKLNVMKVAENLRWAYLSPEQARAKGADVGKHARLKKVLERIEKIFYGAGGKPENLKKAILTGKGNKDKAVNGLGYVDGFDGEVYGVDEYLSLSGVLGAPMYQSEFVDGLDGLEGFGELGEPATGAALAAAATVIATIAAAVKSVGSLFKKKGGGDSEAGGESSTEEGGGETISVESEGSNEVTTEETGGAEARSDGGGADSETDSPASDEGGGDEAVGKTATAVATNTGNTNTSVQKTSSQTAETDEPKGFKAFFQKNKTWLIPTGVGVGGLLIYLGIRAAKKKKKAATNHKASLNGFPSRKKRRGKKHRPASRKRVIDLM